MLISNLKASIMIHKVEEQNSSHQNLRETQHFM